MTPTMSTFKSTSSNELHGETGGIIYRRSALVKLPRLAVDRPSKEAP
jgi:hypothetical protein